MQAHATEALVTDAETRGRPRPVSPGATEKSELDRTFSTLVEQHADMAYNVAHRMLRCPYETEDAVQEAFIHAYRAFPTFKGNSKPSTWLYRIVVNTCLMKIRKDKSRTKYISETGYDDSVVPGWGNDPEKAAINGELREVLEEGLDRLSPEMRAAVVLRDVQGFSTEEAAKMLKVSVPGLKSRLHRGRVLLRKHMEGYLNNRSQVDSRIAA